MSEKRCTCLLGYLNACEVHGEQRTGQPSRPSLEDVADYVTRLAASAISDGDNSAARAYGLIVEYLQDYADEDRWKQRPPEASPASYVCDSCEVEWVGRGEPPYETCLRGRRTGLSHKWELRQRPTQAVVCDQCGGSCPPQEFTYRGQRFCGLHCASVALDDGDDEERDPVNGQLVSATVNPRTTKPLPEPKGFSFDWDTVNGKVAYDEETEEWTINGGNEGRMSPICARLVLAKLVAPEVGGPVSQRTDYARNVDAWKDKDDKALPEDTAIAAVFPTRSGRHDLYEEAMRLVGARFSKAGLVALVNWLLHRAEARPETPSPAADHEHEKARSR